MNNTSAGLMRIRCLARVAALAFVRGERSTLVLSGSIPRDVWGMRREPAHGCARPLRLSLYALLPAGCHCQPIANKLPWSTSWADTGRRMYKTCIVRSEQLPRSKSEHNAQYGSFSKARAPIDPGVLINSMHADRAFKCSSVPVCGSNWPLDM